jgi:hypothetical protein
MPKPKGVKTRLLKAECGACGYLTYQSRRWLAIGPPLCPNADCPRLGLALTDAREEEDPFGEARDMPKSLGDKFVKIRKTRECAECGRHHDIGAIMHLSTASVAGKIVSAHFCRDCSAQIEYDRLPCAPDGNRIFEGAVSERAS